MFEIEDLINHLMENPRSKSFEDMRYSLDERTVTIDHSTMENFKFARNKDTRKYLDYNKGEVEVPFLWTPVKNLSCPFYKFIIRMDTSKNKKFNYLKFDVKYIGCEILLHKSKRAIDMNYSRDKFENCIFTFDGHIVEL